MRWWALVALCGCNSVFGLHELERRDAAFYDAMPDAAPTCPSGEAPQFSPVLHQVVLQRCFGYVTVAGRATCACFTANGLAICEGPAGDELPEIDLGLAGFAGQVDMPHLTPDASELFVRVYDYDTNAQSVREYVRQVDGTWQRGPDAPFAKGTNDTFGMFATSPSGIRTIVRTVGDASLQEWIREGTQWRTVQAQGSSPDGFAPYTFEMTTDGLHAIMGTTSGALYFERPDLDAAFVGAEPMTGVPGESYNATMTDDCGRVHVTGLGGVFDVQRL